MSEERNGAVKVNSRCAAQERRIIMVLVGRFKLSCWAEWHPPQIVVARRHRLVQASRVV